MLLKRGCNAFMILRMAIKSTMTGLPRESIDLGDDTSSERYQDKVWNIRGKKGRGGIEKQVLESPSCFCSMEHKQDAGYTVFSAH